jgi:mono/diheme cytochrome c family protein
MAARFIRALAAAAFVALVVLPVVSAQEIKREPARRLSSISGAATFSAYCAACHGAQAKGNGPAALALKTPPADLTTYAKRHGGTFSATDVESKVLGRALPPAHGATEMPIWGPVFRDVSVDEQERKLRVANLVDYLKSIQLK